MNPLAFMVNAARRLENMFPGYFPDQKHDHIKDFGYPTTVIFNQTYQMYLRNGVARAAVEKTILKTWQDNPTLWETEKPEETEREKEIRQKFDDLRLWQKLAEADRRAMVGGYAGVILRFADSKRFSEPVDTVPGGLDGLVEIIPAWEGQLTVSEWDGDERSETYGQPLMFGFNEAAVGDNQRQAKNRSFELHPDRVIVWSKDGTVHNRSDLEPGFNDLITMEKISGAGGEGFWKNSKSTPILETDAGVSIEDMAKGMNVPVAEIADKMNEQVEDFNKGFDAMLMLQGLKAKTLGVTLPIPEHFFAVALNAFAASMLIPVKILIGMQTGERASTEDADEWAQTNKARRVNIAIPNIMQMVQRLERFGILPERDWHLHWPDLTEASMAEKIDRAVKMAEVNAKMLDEPVFLPEEIRAAVDMKALGDLPDPYGEEGDEDE
jgi:hypothetical protein